MRALGDEEQAADDAAELDECENEALKQLRSFTLGSAADHAPAPDEPEDSVLDVLDDQSTDAEAA